MKIDKVEAIEILDSRGNPTVQTYLWAGGKIIAKSSVPSGASTGEHEACELRDQEKRYMGKGVLKAVENVNGPINDVVKGLSIDDQESIDQKMIEADGTKNKTRFGANAILSVSLAVASARAHFHEIPLFEAIRKQKEYSLPCPMMNIINGGAHADNSIDFQEFMIRPHGAKTMQEAVQMGSEIFHTLKKILNSKGHNTNVGDEGGFAPNLSSTNEALDTIMQAIQEAGYQPKSEVSLALDCASSELFDRSKNMYVEKYSKEKREMSATALIDDLEKLTKKYPIDSIEDGLDENDWEGWKEMTKRLGEKIQIVGDDIFVTNREFLQKGIEMHVANSILIKLNQIGTLTETLHTIDLAQKAGYTTVVSHRSGETASSFIADLAVATNSGQIKTGSLCRSDRLTKYNRLMEIEHFLKQFGSFKDSNPFH